MAEAPAAEQVTTTAEAAAAAPSPPPAEPETTPREPRQLPESPPRWSPSSSSSSSSEAPSESPGRRRPGSGQRSESGGSSPRGGDASAAASGGRGRSSERSHSTAHDSPAKRPKLERPAPRGGGVGGQQGWRPVKTNMCWYGMECTKPNCWFLHPEGWNPKAAKLMRYAEGVVKNMAAAGNLDRRREEPPQGDLGWLPAGLARGRGDWPPAHESATGEGARAKGKGKKGKRGKGKGKGRGAAGDAAPQKAHGQRMRWAAPGSRSASPARSASGSSRSGTGGAAAPRLRSAGAARFSCWRASRVAPEAKAYGSFRSFVAAELSDSVTSEEAFARWDEHQKRVAEARLAPLAGTALFWDTYGPQSALRLHDLGVHAARLRAEAFVQSVRDGLYDGLSLRAQAGSRRGAAQPVAGHLEPPHFALDPSVNALLLDQVPAEVSVWDLCTALWEHPGLEAVAWSRPRAGALERLVRARFSTALAAGEAHAALSGAKLECGFEVRAVLLAPEAELSGLVVPPEMSHPDRIAADEILSARLVRLLDGLMGVSPLATEALLSFAGGAEGRLDLNVLYLRRVHHFCFYSAAWCDDEWELHGRCGAAALRGAAEEEGEEPPAPASWAREHQGRLEAFLASASLERPALYSAERVERDAARLCREQTQAVTGEKFHCRVCGKFFKGPDYVARHLRKVHAGLFEALRGSAMEEAAVLAFQADLSAWGPA